MRQPFPELLTDVCTRLVDELQASRSILFLYDDFADAFSIVAGPGAGFDPASVPPLVGDSAEVLRSCLLAGEPRSFASADLLFSGPSIELAQWLGEGPLLIAPLRDGTPVGVIALSDARFAPNRLSEVRALAGSAARRIVEGRPDLEHDCLFRSLLEHFPGGAAVLEGERHVFSYASPALRAMLNADPVPFLGRTLDDVVAGDTDRRLAVLVAEAARTGKPLQAANLELTDQYGPRFYDVHVLPQSGQEDRPAPNILILWPQTEVVTMRQALQASFGKLAESQGLLAAVLNATNQGIVLIGPDMIVLYANRRIAEILGLDVTDVIGRDQRQVLEEYLVSHSAATEGRGIDPGAFEETRTDELELTQPVHRILERYRAPVYTDEGTLLGRIEVFSDVTDVRLLQRNKDEFLSVVSHELRTPVTSIKGYAQLLQRRAQREPTSESTLAAYGTIERQSQRMQELIDMLLDLTRLEQGRLRLQLTELNLGDLVSRAAEMVQMTTEHHTIELQLQARQIWITGDEHRLEQVMLNLLSNAIRYSPAGGTVTVTVGQLDEAVRIAIEDRGIGISPDALPHVFERFYRVGDESVGAGLGVGLYITQRIVEQHGGSMSVSSELGHGSTFVVTLPSRAHPANEDRD